jgi:hypothetical protein
MKGRWWPAGTHGKLDGKIEKQHQAWYAVNDQVATSS